MKSNWQRHVLAATGYRELGMFDEAERTLEEIDAEDKHRKEVLACASGSLHGDAKVGPGR